MKARSRRTSQQQLIDRDGVLMTLTSGTHVHPATEFTEKDVIAALLVLDQTGFDMLIFGREDDGEFWRSDFESESTG